MVEDNKDKLRTRLIEDLVDVTEDASRLGVPDIVWQGICFFTQMAIDCAPTVAEGRKLVKDAAKAVRKSPKKLIGD